MGLVYLLKAPGALVTMRKEVELDSSPAIARGDFVAALGVLEPLVG